MDNIMDKIMNKLTSVLGMILKGIGYVLGLLKYVRVVEKYLLKGGDFLDNYKLDDSYKG